MGSYKLAWFPSVEKDFKRIDKQYIANIRQEIKELKNSPYPHGCRKLSGTHQTYRIRIGDYRVIYQINENQKEICIEKVKHRKKVYRKL